MKRGGSEERLKRSDGRYPCFEFDKTGSCKFGEACNFSHLGESDAGSSTTRPNKKTKKRGVCLLFVGGKCTFGDECKYRHAEQTAEEVAEEVAIAKALVADTPEEILKQIMLLPESVREKTRKIFFAKQKKGDFKGAASSKPKRADKVCYGFQNGNCTKGDACIFMHVSDEKRIPKYEEKPEKKVLDPNAPKLCRWFLKGSCSRGDDCLFAHNQPIN